MHIVSQSAPFSPTPFPSMPPMLLLAAPPPLKLICAPSIAGLLPAIVPPVPVRVEVIFGRKPATGAEREAILRELKAHPPRTIEEMNAELAPAAERLMNILIEWREFSLSRSRARSSVDPHEQ